MAQKQLLLIVMSVILVGIAVTVGIAMFSSHNKEANKNAIIIDIINIADSAYEYRVKHSSLGGGQGSYNNYQLPAAMQSNKNAGYEVFVSDGGDVITIIGRSNFVKNAEIIASYDRNLNLVLDVMEHNVLGINPDADPHYKKGFVYSGW